MINIIISIFPVLISSQHVLNYNNPIHTARLYGGYELGYYYVNFYLGTPQIKQSLIVDTGSSITTFPCKECGSNCGKHIDKQFDPNKSSTFEIVKCHESLDKFKCNQCDQNQRCIFSISYLEGSSLYGFFLKDFVIFGDLIVNSTNKDNNQVKTVFGCTTKETHLFFTQEADGILGLAPLTDNQDQLPNIIDDLFSQHNDQLAFSLCYSNKNGFMAIGGYNKWLHTGDTYVIPYRNPRNLYEITIEQIQVENEKSKLSLDRLNAGQHSPIIDSGTTLTYFQYGVYESIIDMFNTYCHQGENKCANSFYIFNKCFQFIQNEYFQNLQQFYDSFPVIKFQLSQSYTYEWNPQDYLIDEANNKHCFGFENYPTTILGGTWMRHHDILFDRKNQTIHFTKSNCDGNLSSINYDFNITNFKKKIKFDPVVLAQVLFVCLLFSIISIVLYVIYRRHSQVKITIQSPEINLNNNQSVINISHSVMIVDTPIQKHINEQE